MSVKKTSKQPQLEAEKRKLLGRQVKKLRRQSVLPANIYGNKIKSLAVKLDLKSFLPVFKKVGETGLVELKVEGEQKIRPALIHNVQLDPVTDEPLHADFYQVDLKEKVTAAVPVELIGVAPAAEQKIGILIQPLAEVEVEALPTDLPDKLTVNISKLEKIDDSLTVAELKAPSGVKILVNEKETVAKIDPPAKEEEKPAPVAEAAEGEEAEATEKPEGEAEAKEETREEKKEEEKPKETQEEKKEEK